MYTSYQHVFLLEQRRNNTMAYKDLLEYGYTASLTGDEFSAVHGD